MRNVIIGISINRPGVVMGIVGVMCAVMLMMVALPGFVPGFGGLPPVMVDTDPENMLSEDEEVRVYHNRMREVFDLHDVIVVGVVDDRKEPGVFNVQTLGEVHDLAEFASGIKFGDEGVIGSDILAPNFVDNIEQAGLGSVRFEWLMKEPPATEEEAAALAGKAARLPFLKDTLISGDSKALALYIPVTSKKISFKVAQLLRERIQGYTSGSQYYITGLPVAQDQFGVEMFKQMAVSAPVAMLLIFVLMWIFFRQVNLIISPMLVAMAAVILTMGLLIVTGNTIHIMSSMIPIFIMPIAVLDAVHILSDFFDVYPKTRDRRKALEHVMGELWTPMMFTSLTTCAGFASLALTPIPPVRVFGIFISAGVLLAWILTVTLVPAYIMRMPAKSFEKFGRSHNPGAGSDGHGWFSNGLLALGDMTLSRARVVIIFTVVLGAGAVLGISKIQINDNPVKWFEPGHDIRIADAAMNGKFAGTYMAYLTFEAPELTGEALLDNDLIATLPGEVQATMAQYSGRPITELEPIIQNIMDSEESDDLWNAWDQTALTLSEHLQSRETFKNPEVLKWMQKLQTELAGSDQVGKSNGLPDIISTVHRELFLGEDQAYRIPDTSNAVAQTLITYQSSHRPGDLWHFVTPDYRKANLWIQLKSGDNRDMQKVIGDVQAFIESNPPPTQLSHNWFGLTYINVVWQQKMVAGMMEAFIGSFVIVLVMMVLLFRSLWWGILSMIPLAVTIAAIYGFIGMIGKDYDMPVAVLSSLSLGLAVDYAIHFLARSREIRKRCGSWGESVSQLFGEPARAIARNVIVIGVGFLPLLLAPLVPYQTVGFFISAILVVAGLASLIILPAIITLTQKWLFTQKSYKPE